MSKNLKKRLPVVESALRTKAPHRTEPVPTLLPVCAPH
ncbi:hypothetical protein [Polaromonas sp. CG9_12]|nr:hypothetical protein [Polaromonas sp. CG9_12]